MSLFEIEPPDTLVTVWAFSITDIPGEGPEDEESVE